VPKFSSRISSILKSTHPVPSFSVALFTMMFSFGIDLPGFKIALVPLAVLMQQFSVGLSNDWLDYSRDLSSKRADKPVALGEVSPSLIKNLSILAGLAALLLSSALGILNILCMLLMLLVGWGYNLGLKANWLSFLPYAIGFGILPVFVTVSLPTAQLPPLWLVIAAALLGVSAHFSNVLPDILEDIETGIFSLPHVLGQRISAVIIFSCAVGASAIVVSQTPQMNQLFSIGVLLATILFSGTASILVLRKKPPRIVFTLLLVTAFTNVVLLVAALGTTRLINL
jgi:4-hydroxybenzoate polyprenyltransferase